MRKVPRSQSPPASDVHTAAAAQNESSHKGSTILPSTAQQMRFPGSNVIQPQQETAGHPAIPAAAWACVSSPSRTAPNVSLNMQHMQAGDVHLADPKPPFQQQSASAARRDALSDRDEVQQQIFRVEPQHAARAGTSGPAAESPNHRERQQAAPPGLAPDQPGSSIVAEAIASTPTSAAGSMAVGDPASTPPMPK